MVIALTPIQEGVLWEGFTWTVEDENALAGLLARVAIGQARVAERILHEDGLVRIGFPRGGHEGARNLLKVGPSGDPSHRDGWMFQVISWIAAHRAGRPALIRSPHMRHADKGLDGLLVEFDDTDIARIVISEEKATGNARTMVRDRIWPEFQDFETGRRDAELVDGVSMLLAGARHPNPDAVVAAILWAEIRIVEESHRDGVTLAEVARRHEISRSMLYDWRYRHKLGLLGVSVALLSRFEGCT